MKNSILKDLLKEYESKRLQHEKEAEARKSTLFQKYPQLEQIESQINQLALTKIKNILQLSSTSHLSDFESQMEKLKNEKSMFLKNIGLNDDYFLPNFDCSHCQDTGFIQDSSGSVLCNCLKQKILDIEYNKSNINNLAKENFDTFNSLVYSNEIREEKYHCNISPRKNIETIKDLSMKFVQNFDDPNSKNLLFTGNTGLGKTFLSNCIANEILKLGKTVLYQTAPTMLDSIIDFRFGKNTDDIYHTILTTDLLIIDDLGTEYMNSVKFAELFNIVNTRILNQNHHVTKTIISTNLSLKDLFRTYDERIVSRIVGFYDICRFFGEDIRFCKNRNL